VRLICGACGSQYGLERFISELDEEMENLLGRFPLDLL